MARLTPTLSPSAAAAGPPPFSLCVGCGAPVSRPWRAAPRHRRKLAVAKGIRGSTGDARSVGVSAAGTQPNASRTPLRHKRVVPESGEDPVERGTGLRAGSRDSDVDDAPTSADPSSALVCRTVPFPAGGSRPRTLARAPWHPCRSASTIHRRPGGHRVARPSPPPSAWCSAPPRAQQPYPSSLPPAAGLAAACRRRPGRPRRRSTPMVFSVRPFAWIPPTPTRH